MRITVRVDNEQLLRNIQALGPASRKAISKALNRTAFEIRLGEQEEAARSFKLKRLRPNFRFDPATMGNLLVKIMPMELTERYVHQHVTGADPVVGEGPRRLKVGGGPAEFAVPILPVLGRTTGRVPKRQAPASLLKGGKSYIAKSILFTRAKKGAKAVAMYFLTPVIHLKPRFAYYRRAKSEAQFWFPYKAREEYQKIKFK